VPTPLTGDRTFRNDVVRLADLTVQGITVDGYEFVNCRIMGPAVVVLQDSSIVSCGWDGPDVNSIFWEVPDTRPLVIGAIAVINCTFSNCRFEGVGVAGPPQLREQLEQGFSDGPRPSLDG
jgi:hypothetical protein